MADVFDALIDDLRDLGADLDLAPGDPVAAAVERIRAGTPAVSARPRWRGRVVEGRERVLLAAAAVLLVAMAATVAIPGSRQAVARWIGIGQVTVTYTDEIPDTAGRAYDLGTAVPLERAIVTADRAGWRLRAPGVLGEPDRALVGRPAGSVTLVWAPAADLPEIHDSGLGLVLTAMPGTTDAGGMSKQGTMGTTVELVRVGDRPAYWIAGAPHEVVITDPDGRVVHDTSRLAGNTLVWTEGDVTYRLESAHDREEAVELAGDLRTVMG
jgi:hypothetical protein